MSKKIKRALVMLMAVSMIFTSVPINAEASGTTKENDFSLDEIGGVIVTPKTGITENTTTETSVQKTGTDAVKETVAENVPETVAENVDEAAKETANKTVDETVSVPVAETVENKNVNHYKMDASKSANVTLYVTTGDDVRLKALNPGDEFVTESPNTYFFVRVPDGYAAATSFEHNYAFGDASRTEYPGWGSTKTSYYYGMYDSNDPNTTPPRWSDADALGCTYKFQYTGKSGSSGNFWTQFAIKGTPIEVSVVYDANGGKSAPQDSTIYYHENVTEYNTHVITISSQEPVPAQNNKTFYGWQASDGAIYQPGDQIKINDIWNSIEVNGTSGSITLKAVWEDKVSISYNANGNTGGKNVADTKLYNKGESAVVMTNTWLKYNYEFTGWNTKADGSGTTYQSGDTVTLNANTVLYAQWSRKKQVYISYEAGDGGSVSRTQESVNTDDGEPEGSTATAKEGYKFVGWVNDNGEVVSTEPTFKPVIPEDTNEVTFTAKFEKIKDIIVSPESEAVIYEITVAANGGSAKYDGTAHTVSGYTISGDTKVTDISENADGYSFTVGGKTFTLTGLYTSIELNNQTEAVNAGTYNVIVDGKAVIRDENGNDVTDRFKVNMVDSTLVIEKRNVVLTSATRTAQYSGQPLEAATVEVSGDGFVNGEGATYVFSDNSKASGPNMTVVNAFEYRLNDNTNADNYNITKKEGTLTLTNREGEARYKLLIEANSGTWTYDGEEHTVGGFKTSDTFMVEGAIYKVTGLTVNEVTAKDYQDGGYAVNITGAAVVTDEYGNDVTDQFIVETKNGTLTINKRPVMLTSASSQKVYDGTALRAESVTDSYNAAGQTGQPGFVSGDGAVYSFTESRTLPGTSENLFTYELKDGTKESNYIISQVNGTLNVQNRGNGDTPLYTITLKPISAEAIYDGTEKRIDGFEENVFEFDGQTYEVKYIQATAKGTEPGVYRSSYSGTAVVVDSEGNDVTDQFAIDTTATGTLTIKGVYTLTINYIDTVGTTLAPSYVGRFVEGTTFGPIDSPAVDGYTPAYSSVYSPASGMPNRDVTVNVVYTALAAVPAATISNAAPENTPADTTNDTTNDTANETPADTTDNTVSETADNITETPVGRSASLAQSSTAVPEVPIPAIPVAIGEQTPTDRVTIDDEETPKGIISFDENGNAEIIEIEDDPTALAAGFGKSAWALINLIAAILTAVICIVLLITWIIGKKKDDEEDEENEADKADTDEKDEEDEDKKKRQRTALKLISIIPAVASVIIFCITENMKNPMILVDKWTILMIVLLVVEILIAFFSRNKEDDEKEDEYNDEDKK